MRRTPCIALFLWAAARDLAALGDAAEALFARASAITRRFELRAPALDGRVAVNERWRSSESGQQHGR